ncbi:MAG: YicC family protein [Christensenellaceae bacterium]|nr:YicC family protein [Christensenellaceae bacterium]
MARSMTGFGRASLNIDGRELTIELKSVNHRYLDIGFRMHRSLGFLEDTVRTTLSSMLSRGHIDVYATYRNTRNDAKCVNIDTALLSAYLESARIAGEQFMLTDDLTLSNVLRLPDIATVIEADEDRDSLTELMKRTVACACEELIEMRIREGERLRNDLLLRLDTVLAIRKRIEERAPLVTEEYRNKLNERIATILSEVEVDRARLATEIALFADRVNIDEELVRLMSHITAARDLLESDKPIGRKLEFVVQEMNREFNTIGSKANDKDISALVIDGKAELEKIREQIQNFE